MLSLGYCDVLIPSALDESKKLMEILSLMPDQDAESNVILVDEAGTAFLAIAPPCSNHLDRFSNQARRKEHKLFRKDAYCTPQKEINNEIKVVTESTKRQQPSPVVFRNRKYTHEEDKEFVETAIFERKSRLEKDAEHRAEVVFKQWYKEKKTLQQVIDESLRYKLNLVPAIIQFRFRFLNLNCIPIL
jgi:hypothetical protein